jgi:hypothetical protein
VQLPCGSSALHHFCFFPGNFRILITRGTRDEATMFRCHTHQERTMVLQTFLVMICSYIPCGKHSHCFTNACPLDRSFSKTHRVQLVRGVPLDSISLKFISYLFELDKKQSSSFGSMYVASCIAILQNNHCLCFPCIVSIHSIEV